MIARLNWEYWFNELPKAVYGGSSTWWDGIPEANLPTFTIIDYGDNIKARFNSSLNSANFTQEGGSPSSSEFSIIRALNIGEPYSSDPLNDPVFNINYGFGFTYVFGLKYSFTPLSSSVSSDYSSVTTPIIKEERITLFELPSGKGECSLSFPYNYGVDMSDGVTNPSHPIVDGFFLK